VRPNLLAVIQNATTIFWTPIQRLSVLRVSATENPNHGVALSRNRAHGAEEQNRSRSIKWAAKQENLQPEETCFFLTSSNRVVK
jgi:hypothetical protein